MKTNRQNPVKRTIVSFSIAFATALMTLFIQNITNERVAEEQKLQAKVYPKSTFLLKR